MLSKRPVVCTAQPDSGGHSAWPRGQGEGVAVEPAEEEYELPSQVCDEVLCEMPPVIQAQLKRKREAKAACGGQSRGGECNGGAEASGSPLQLEGYDLPSLSQVSMEVVAQMEPAVRRHYEREHQRLQARREAALHERRQARRSSGGASSSCSAFGRSSAAPGSSWTCSVCTYVHLGTQAEYLACDMCGATRNLQETHATGGEGERLAADSASAGLYAACSRRADCEHGRAANTHRQERHARDRVGSTCHAAETSEQTVETSIEPWPMVRPHVAKWLAVDEYPSSTPLIQYADALVGAARLEEVGYLANFLAEECADRMGCSSMLHDFATTIEQRVRDHLGESTDFKPLVLLRRRLRSPSEQAPLSQAEAEDTSVQSH